MARPVWSGSLSLGLVTVPVEPDELDVKGCSKMTRAEPEKAIKVS